jgi:hypothetical protein
MHCPGVIQPDTDGTALGVIVPDLRGRSIMIDPALLDGNTGVNITLPRRVLKRRNALAAPGESRSGWIARMTLKQPRHGTSPDAGVRGVASPPGGVWGSAPATSP